MFIGIEFFAPEEWMAFDSSFLAWSPTTDLDSLIKTFACMHLFDEEDYAKSDKLPKNKTYLRSFWNDLQTKHETLGLLMNTLRSQPDSLKF